MEDNATKRYAFQNENSHANLQMRTDGPHLYRLPICHPVSQLDSGFISYMRLAISRMILGRLARSVTRKSRAGRCFLG